MQNFIKLLISIIICTLSGVLGTFFTIQEIPTWYVSLNKPFFNPPNWIFGPVWTTLYICMGVAVYLVWQKGLKKEKVQIAIKLFAIQLLLNAIWSPVFFGLHNLILALVIIIFMWFYIYRTIVAFSKINKLSAYLMYPYLAWVSFATLLNFSIWMLN